MTRTSRKISYAALAVLSIAAAALPAHSKVCIKWRQVMAQGRVERLPAKGPSVLVEDFENFTKRSEDAWLTTGLRDLAADLLSSSDRARVLSGITARADAGPRDYKIGGFFQHIDGNLRVFIRLSEAGPDKLIEQRELVFPYPDNKELFTDVAGAVEGFMKRMKIRHDAGLFAAVRDATASTKAYESYSKGRQLLETYDLANMQRAMAYFREAKRIDHRSPLGYQGIAAVESFSGLNHKQAGKPFSTYYQRAQAELGQMAKIARPVSPVFGYLRYKPEKRGERAPAVSDRFVLGHAAFMAGTTAQGSGNLDSAAAEFKKAVKLVPEDALAWYHLARVESLRGNLEEAARAQSKASSINPCIEK